MLHLSHVWLQKKRGIASMPPPRSGSNGKQNGKTGRTAERSGGSGSSREKPPRPRPSGLQRASKVQLLGLAGFIISLYALSVESHIDDPTYVAMCDLGKGASCAEVFKSSYAHVLSHWGVVPRGHPLDLSLALAGLTLYSAYFYAGGLWNHIPYRQYVFITVASAGACFSCYLLYVLKVILQDFCIVCTSFHVVNFSMLYLATREVRAPQPAARTVVWRMLAPMFVAGSIWWAPRALAPEPGVESWLMFDGVCNLCDGFVNFVAAGDSQRRVKFGAQQKNMELLERVGAPTDLSTLVLIQGPVFYTHSAAALRTLALMDWPWRAIAALNVVPRPLRDFGYRIVALSRYRVFGKADVCREPTGEFKSRFIDYEPDPDDDPITTGLGLPSDFEADFTPVNKF